MNNEDVKFDAIVIGGGHAGLEAAWSISKSNRNVAIITMPGIPIASAPCNPAIGGVGKSQLVKEIDCLGGIMGKIADLSAIQYRVLNESKGYAVRSTRVQIDKEVYAETAEKLVSENEYITVIRKRVDSVIKDKDTSIFTVSTSDGDFYQSLKIVVTTGTFLNGKLHTGPEQKEGGRVDCLKSNGIDDIFSGVSKLAKRFKTGTPARLKIETVDFSKMISQKSDESALNFHSLHDLKERYLPQVSCHITHTNENTMQIIRDNKELSPMFNGQINAVGARYCPSLEDKAFRYPDRNSHHVFVEPEGLKLNTVYPNGISTSLPKEVQLDFIRTINGLENAEIEVYGYAVEYDVVDTTRLSQALESQDIPGLYFAGQVNGTSGYEEAAGQGLVAGINIIQKLENRDPIYFSREDSYLGVLIEDLTGNLRDEPYRLFTARSENRLYVREDNSINRMAFYRSMLKMDDPIDKYQRRYLENFELLKNLCDSTIIHANKENKKRFKEQAFGKLESNISFSELLKRSQLDPIKTLEKELDYLGLYFSADVMRAVAISTKYEGYINRAELEKKRFERFGQKRLDWESLIECQNISFECRQRIKEIRPETFSQLKRINGIRPATLAYVVNFVV